MLLSSKRLRLPSVSDYFVRNSHRQFPSFPFTTKFSSSAPSRLFPMSYAKSLKSIDNPLQDASSGPKIYKWTVHDLAYDESFADRSGDPFLDNGETITASSEIKHAVYCGRRRIYIVGIGNMGRLLASALARLPNRPAITLVVHRRDLLEHWRCRPGVVLHPKQYLTDSSGVESEPTSDFDVEMWSEDPPPGPNPAEILSGDVTSGNAGSARSDAHIPNLIMTTKSQDSLPQVDRLRRYLGPDSTVVFVHNGMAKLWPPYGPVYNKARYNQSQHPCWLAAIVTHGVVSVGPFESVHASPANMVVGSIDASETSKSQAADTSGSYLARLLLSSPLLNARCVPTAELWVMQLEKLVVNSVINPLTAILRCRNGELFRDDMHDGRGGNPNVVAQIIDHLLMEASNVLQCLIRHDPYVFKILDRATGSASDASNTTALVERLAFAKLRSMVYRVGELVKDNTSSMLQDVLAGKPTEIREINGWFVEMALYIGSLRIDGVTITKPDVTAHETLVELVSRGVCLTRSQLVEYFPLYF